MSPNTNGYGPSFPACRLWEKTSAKGTKKHLTGQLGGVQGHCSAEQPPDRR
jgi:hypothetical protein